MPAAPQACDTRDHVLDIGIVDTERTCMLGGVGQIVPARTAPPFGESDVVSGAFDGRSPQYCSARDRRRR